MDIEVKERSCEEPAISLQFHHVSLVQWTTCLLPVSRDPGSNPQGGVLVWNQDSSVSVVSLQSHHNLNNIFRLVRDLILLLSLICLDISECAYVLTSDSIFKVYIY